MTRIVDLDAPALARHYAAGRLSPVEVLRDVLARSAPTQEALNPFVLLDPERALAAAAASERRWRAGAPLSSLDGIPATVKDNILAAGWPTRRGSTLTATEPAQADAPAVARLREAGVVFFAKTTMPEFGWKGVGDSPLTGVTRNPWDPSRGPGGSSSGAAVAAALNLGRVHLGTDGAGSIRIPAGFTGVTGFKASYGRVPAWPLSTMGYLSHVGPLTRTVREAALALDRIARPDPRDATAMIDPPPSFSAALQDGVRGLRIAWSPRLGLSHPLDPEVEALTTAAARGFEALGASVEEADPGFADPIDLLDTVWCAGAALALQPFGPAQRSRMDPGLVAEAERGERVTGAAYAEALLFGRNALAGEMAGFHARFDLLLTPALPLAAFEAGRDTPADGCYGDRWTAWTPYTYPFNITGQPALVVPCGVTRAGLPIGLQFVGGFGQDALVLRAGAAFEAAHPFPRPVEPAGGAT